MVYLCSARIGIEYVYIHLYEKLGTRIHVSYQEWQQYGRIPDLAKALTTDTNVKARIHACVVSFPIEISLSIKISQVSTHKILHGIHILK